MCYHVDLKLSSSGSSKTCSFFKCEIDKTLNYSLRKNCSVMRIQTIQTMQIIQKLEESIKYYSMHYHKSITLTSTSICIENFLCKQTNGFRRLDGLRGKENVKWINFLMKIEIEIDIKSWCELSCNNIKCFFLCCFLTEWITLIWVAVHLHSFSISTHWMRVSSMMTGKLKLNSSLNPQSLKWSNWLCFCLIV